MNRLKSFQKSSTERLSEMASGIKDWPWSLKRKDPGVGYLVKTLKRWPVCSGRGKKHKHP